MKLRRKHFLLIALLMAVIAVAVAEIVADRIAARDLRQPDYEVAGSTGFHRPNPDRITGPGMDWVRESYGQDRPQWQGQWIVIRPDDIIRLGPDAEARAIAELDRRPVVKLTADQFQAYTGRPHLPPEPVQAFLVRGVEYDEHPGSCLEMRYSEGDSLVVTCPIGDTSLKKRPVILLVKTQIVRVYFEFMFLG